MYYIYKITSKFSNKCYIGGTTNYRNRWIQHRSLLRHNKHYNLGLQKDYNITQNMNDMLFEIIDQTDAQLSKRQKAAMEQTQTDKYYPNVHNLGNAGVGTHTFPEYRKNMKQTLKTSPKVHRRSIIKLTLQLDYLADYSSVTDSAIELWDRCTATQITTEHDLRVCKNHIFLYKDDYENPQFMQDLQSRLRQRVVNGKFILHPSDQSKSYKSLYRLNGGTGVFERIDSIGEASRGLGVCREAIKRALQDPFRRTCGGYVWIWESQYEDKGFIQELLNKLNIGKSTILY